MMGIEKSFERVKEHRIAAIIMLVLVIIFAYPFLSPDTLPVRGGPGMGFPAGDIHFNAANTFIIRQAMKSNEVPLWSPYTMSGTPFYAKPQVPFFYITWLINLIAPTAWAALKWSMLVHVFIAGISMYSLFFYLRKDKMPAFIAALCYMLSGYLTTDFFAGHPNIVYSYAWVPLIALFSIKAMKSRSMREAAKNSAWTGIFLAFQVLGGGPQVFLYTLLIVGVIFIFYLAASRPKEQIKKVIVAGIITLLVFGGITAVKFLPIKEVMKISVRAGGYSFKDSVGNPIEAGEFWSDLIHPGPRNLGVIPFFLMLFSLPLIRKKDYALFWALAVFSLFILSGSFVFFLIWKYVPYFNKMDDLFKGIFLFVFPASYLAGAGSQVVCRTLKKRFNLSRVKAAGVYIAIAVFIILNLVILSPRDMGSNDPKEIRQHQIYYPAWFARKFSPPYSPMPAQLEKNDVMQFMAKDRDIFRIHVFETNGIDWGTDSYTVPLGLQDVYGTENIWLTDYLPIFLSVANSQPARLFGLLNTKYLTSKSPLNISGFTLIGKSGDCGILCQPDKSDGPYLYLNRLWLPRYFFAEHAVLILGEENFVRQTSYGILTSPEFDQASTIVVFGRKKLDGYDISELRNFDIIIMGPGSYSSDPSSALRSYIEDGGVLIPDLLHGENILNGSRILSSLRKLRGGNFVLKAEPEYKKNYDIVFDNIAFDKISSEAVKEGSWMFLSEKFSMFDGWKAFIDGKPADIYRADGVLSAVYIPASSRKVEFVYNAPLYKDGLMITLASLALIILCFAYDFKAAGGMKKRSGSRKQQES